VARVHRLVEAHAATEAGLGGVLGAPFGIAIGEMVHHADIHELLEPECLVVAQGPAGVQQLPGSGDFIGEFAHVGWQALERVLEARFHLLSQLVWGCIHGSLVNVRWCWCGGSSSATG
jgi:hypothetical protein